MVLQDYNAKHVKITDSDGNQWSGFSTFVSAYDNDAKEDALQVEVDGWQHRIVEFFSSELKEIEIV